MPLHTQIRFGMKQRTQYIRQVWFRPADKQQQKKRWLAFSPWKIAWCCGFTTICLRTLEQFGKVRWMEMQSFSVRYLENEGVMLVNLSTSMENLPG